MYSLRPHTKIDFVRLWKYGFRLSGVLIAPLPSSAFVVSTVLTGAPAHALRHRVLGRHLDPDKRCRRRHRR